MFSCILPHSRSYCLRTGKTYEANNKAIDFLGFLSPYITHRIYLVDVYGHMPKEIIAENVLKLTRTLTNKKNEKKNTIILLLSNHNN